MCRDGLPARDHPAFKVGAALGELARAGRDKVTFFLSPSIASLGAWLEQLLAESTGKEGTGLVPVDGETPGSPAVYGDDRVFVYLNVEGEPDERTAAALAALSEAGQPTMTLTLPDIWDVGAEFVRWEIAVAAAGAVLGIDPFDQPNVQESKDNTRRLLRAYVGRRVCPTRPPGPTAGGRRSRWATRSCRRPWASCWSPFSRATTWPFRPTCRRPRPISASCRACACSCATAFAWPRRSATARASCTRQGSSTRAASPAASFCSSPVARSATSRSRGSRTPSGSSKHAQARGDLEALSSRGLRVLSVDLGPDPLPGLTSFGGLVAELLRS